MYSKQVGILRKRIPDLNTEDNHDVQTIELYIFADKYQGEKLMNVAMDSLQDSFKNGVEFVLLKEVELIFEYTKGRPNNPPRRFAVAVMAHAIHSGVISTDPVFVEGRVDDMLLETMERVRYVKNMFGVHNPNPRTRVRRHGWNGIFEYGICEYHQHNSDKNCDTLPNYPNGEN